MALDRVEYLMRLTHDHCDDGDEIANRQHAERVAHVQRGEHLLRIVEGLAELLKRDLRRYGWQGEKPTITQDETKAGMPRVIRQGPREATS